MTNSSPWYRWPIEIDGLSIKNGGSFHGYVTNNQRVTPFILNAVELSDNDPKSEFPQPRTTSILFSPSPCSLLTQLYTAALKLGAQFFSIAGCSMQLAFTKALDQRRGQGVWPCLSLYEICPGNYAGRWNQYYVLYILIHTPLLPGVFFLFLLHATILPASHLSWVPEVCNEDSKVNAPTDHRK